MLLGDPSKAKRDLGWEAETTLETLAQIMTDHDFEIAQRELHAAKFDANESP